MFDQSWQLFSPTASLEIAILTGVWTLIWTVIYFVCLSYCRKIARNHQHALEDQHQEFAERIISLLHSVIIVFGVLLSFIIDGQPSTRDEIIHMQAPALAGFLVPSTGYFVVDTVVTVYICVSKKQPKFPLALDLAHHMSSLFSEFVFLRVRLFAMIVRLLMLTEITTPILHFRWLMIKFKFSGRNILRASMCLLVGFLVFRVGNGLYMVWLQFYVGIDRMIEASVLAFGVVISLTFILLFLNIYWTCLMVKRATSVLFEKKGPRSDSSDKSTILETPSDENA
eukprot:c45842_g1_i1.p1 GENE.c45842_g1_i1~~c45842_g1_i1.p1  ORF type:complete len:292 (+),score=72.71 c45842_g1_i1:29-877(+)